MLYNIRTHLDPSEDKQSQIERESASQIDRTLKRNRLAFKTFAPSALETMETADWNNIGVFSNLNGEVNVVDFTSGQTLYGLNPTQEVENQFRIHSQQLMCAKIDSEEPGRRSALAQKVNCLVLLGLGLGYHLKMLVEQCDISHLIIYEPSLAYSKGSLLAVDWQSILKIAARKKTAIYFQLGSNASNITNDIQELCQHFPIDEFYIYQHYNHQAFDTIIGELSNSSFNYLCSNGLKWADYQITTATRPKWTHCVEPSQWIDISASDDKKFSKNIAAFERYFPSIAKQFSEHTPRNWKPIKNKSGQINLCSIEFNDCFSGQSPRSEGELNYKTFARFPNKDGLVLGYEGEKLKSYTHYRFVKTTENLLNDLEEKQGNLPDEVEALILFGLTQGYQFSSLLEHHEIQNLFICEPEPDFFYASLFALDWHDILETIDKGNRRIYINIGDKGENLFRDLISQFYAIGPYILVNTFFYQSYFRPDLVDSISQLREQLQVVIAMGECYDHARYGIAHTKEMGDRGARFLLSNASSALSDLERETPVFIVGNGPSVDLAIDVIKEERENVILVSCGTSLQVLHKNGITPDFHAEIEQNRATFDWVARVGDFDYLKNIDLISCNGIHPDTCDLFNDTFLAFKEGESSTVSAQKIVGSSEWATLTYAFPTVTNFVINLFLEIEFSQIYLLGVDLGFVSKQNHHSKFSGYYDDAGEEMYDYEEKINTTLYVPGNFRQIVSTKYEFKVAKEIMEQSIAKSSADCFNCADGALIAGAAPLQIESVLISSKNEQKCQTIAAIKAKSFKALRSVGTFAKEFSSQFDHSKLAQSLNQMIALVEDTLGGELSVNALIAKQKTLMFDSYQSEHSLLFYLLYGSSNYANALIVKIGASNYIVEDKASADQTSYDLSPHVRDALSAWKDMLKRIIREYISFPDAYDFAYSMNLQREIVYLKQLKLERGVKLVTSDTFKPLMERYVEVYFPNVQFISSFEEAKNATVLALFEEEDDPQIFAHLNTVLETCEYSVDVVLGGAGKTTFESLGNLHPSHNFANIHRHEPIRTAEQITQWIDGKIPYSSDKMMVGFMCRLISNHGFEGNLVPKVSFSKNAENRKPYLSTIEAYYSDATMHLDFPSYVLLPNNPDTISELMIDTRMNRARPIKGNPQSITFDLPALTHKKVQDITSRFADGDIIPIHGEIISI